MTKEEIMNNYAIEQGYDTFRGLLRFSDLDEIEDIFDVVTDLIQEELRKKMAKNLNIRIEILGQKDLAQITKECYFKESGAKVTIDKISILNTEIL